MHIGLQIYMEKHFTLQIYKENTKEAYFCINVSEFWVTDPLGKKTPLGQKIKKDSWTEQCSWSFLSRCEEDIFCPTSPLLPSFLPPLDVSDSSSGDHIKTQSITHTHTHTSQQLSLYVSTLGLMPAFLSQSLCVVSSSSLSLWSCGLVGPGIQFSCHPDASLSAHTHTNTHSHRDGFPVRTVWDQSDCGIGACPDEG